MGSAPLLIPIIVFDLGLVLDRCFDRVDVGSGLGCHFPITSGFECYGLFLPSPCLLGIFYLSYAVPDYV